MLLASALAGQRDARLRAETATALADVGQELTRWLEPLTDRTRAESVATLITILIDSCLLRRIADLAQLPDELIPALHDLLSAA